MVITPDNFKKTSYALVWLVFSFLHVSCSENKKEELRVSIEWGNGKPTAIRIPYTLLKDISFDSARGSVKVQLEDSGADILGEYSSVDGAIVFRPIIPFTAGLSYKVNTGGTTVARFTIPPSNKNLVSKVIDVFPRGQEMPENLLKMYISFSGPMQEGQALENIYMIRNEKDTVTVFLDLQQELWNKERTILTVWLDPGRIKRGLQPNERAGIPLEQGQRYQLVIDKKWRNAEGLELKEGYSKAFTVRGRDSLLPSIHHWEIRPPRSGNAGALHIKLHEQLDYLLLKNAIRIVDSNGKTIAGTIETQLNETEFLFIPEHPWTKGNYILEAEARLEDLAGNNLDRLFDRDITKETTDPQKLYRRSFSVD